MKTRIENAEDTGHLSLSWWGAMVSRMAPARRRGPVMRAARPSTSTTSPSSKEAWQQRAVLRLWQHPSSATLIFTRPPRNVVCSVLGIFSRQL